VSILRVNVTLGADNVTLAAGNVTPTPAGGIDVTALVGIDTEVSRLGLKGHCGAPPR
jgi:hypothetical protein